MTGFAQLPDSYGLEHGPYGLCLVSSTRQSVVILKGEVGKICGC